MEIKAYYQLDNSKVDDNTRLEMPICYATDCHKGQARDTWNQSFWKMINDDIKDKTVDLISNTQFSFSISISDKQLCFEGAEYGADCDEFFGKDEIEFYYKLDENGTFRMLTQLRIKYGKKKSIENILREEFAVEDGVNHFMEYCEKNFLTYEHVTI